MKKNVIRFMTVLFGLFIIFVNGCEKSHLDPQSANLQVLPVPQNLKAMVDNNLIVISWEYSDTTAEVKYRIFRRDSESSDFFLLQTGFSRDFSDAQVVNGREYAYQVQVVDSRGCFSPRSATITATPALFGIQIEYGNNVVNHTPVQIGLVAPSETTEMCLANDFPTDFSRWQPFSASVQWFLSPNDGLKKVYAKFRNAAGNESEFAVMDSIDLDTKAQIFQFTLEAPDRILSIGDTLNLTLDAHEPGGRATAQIGDWVPIELYDDGTNSDRVAHDGIYATAIVIPPGADVIRSPARGYFLDAAGNTAVSVSSTAVITIQTPPTAVQLLQASRSDSQSIVLYWTKNDDPDFYCYEVLVSDHSNIPDSMSPDTVITNPAQTSFVVNHLAETTTYYFKIRVTDQYGLRSSSNEISAQIMPPKLPEPVFLSHPVDVTAHSVTLQWSPANPANFLNYRIVQYDSAASGESEIIRAHILNPGKTSWTDSVLAANHVYKYQVLVFNRLGQFSRSNLISVKTPVDAPPRAVLLGQPAIDTARSVHLSWTRNSDPDFKAYFVYCSTNSPVNLNNPPNGIINDPLETSFVDSAPKVATAYYYQVVVVDQYNNKAVSNQVVVSFEP